jgi:hypothetical protein
MFVQIDRMKFYCLSCLFLICCRMLPVMASDGNANRGNKTYVQHSVLASGNWYKLAVTQQGIYKIDLSQLSAMGITTASLQSAGIRLFGSGGQMLPENNAANRYDDIPEVALKIEDGGDGVFNGTDYLLFYAPGPHSWTYQAGNYTHTANLYSDTAYYFLNIGTTAGKRFTSDAGQPLPTTTVTSFDYHSFYENDSLNFLSSGKQWWGTVFNNVLPSRTIPFILPLTPTSLKVGVRVAARGLSNGTFSIAVNGNSIGNMSLSPVSGNIFEAFATVATASFPATAAGTSVPVTLRFTPGGSDGQGWLDYITLQGRCALQLPAQEPLFFRDAASIGQTPQFSVSNATVQTTIWDLTDPLQPVAVKTSLNGNTLSFSRTNLALHEYVAFSDNGYQQPRFMGMVPNQDLHDISGVNMLIVTTPALTAAAGRLAAWHSAHDGLTVKVVSVGDIYNEFASGSPDPTAVRDYVKMCYDKGGLQYLLLFGDASYDYKHRLPSNTNMVPTWQSTLSTDPIGAYPSDDYFGFLDDADDINDNGRQNLLAVGVGRLPAQNAAQAEILADKVIHYYDKTNDGRWQQHITFVADDEDNNLHLQDAESMSAIAAQQWSAGRINKIYLDAFPKISDAGGSRYPAVNTAIAEDIYNGTLIWNYTGHGSYSRLAEEVVVDESSLDTWKNGTRLPLFITATCDFAPFDNPAYTSLGEQILLRQNGGGIALMTTTRAVFASSNKVLNANYLQFLLTPGADGKMPTLGEAAKLSKNLTYTTSSDIPNNRKFQLLGDPALTLAFPQYHVVTDSITVPDTLKALGKYTITGHLEDEQGTPQPSYNGTLYTTVYDAPALQYTRANDAGSDKTGFYQQQNILYRGSQTIKSGQFSCTFVVPADINYQAGEPGSISYYGTNGVTTAGGIFSGFRVGGTAPDTTEDTQGPAIRAFLDNEYFKDGGITGENPVLLLHLQDEHGINTSGSGIGHDLVATLDNDPDQYYVLNNFFEAGIDSYQEGTVNFPLYSLSAGLHTLSIKAWDTYNNSGTATLRFKVIKSDEMAIRNVSCFPNPFHNQTSFTFFHNQQGRDLEVTVRIYTINGSQVKTIRHTIKASDSRYVGANWDGTNDAGSVLPPGIYIYGVMVKANGKTQILGGKVILL